MAYTEQEIKEIKSLLQAKKFTEGRTTLALEQMVSYILTGTERNKDFADTALEKSRKQDLQQISNYLNKWMASDSSAELKLNRLESDQQNRLSMLNQQVNTLIEQKEKRVSLTQGYGNYQKNINTESDYEKTIKLINQRLNEVKKEVKGFRKGHEQRLFALNEILTEINSNPEYKKNIDLNKIENNIKEKYQNDPYKLKRFEAGITSVSTSLKSKGQVSQYQQMKDKINSPKKP